MPPSIPSPMGGGGGILKLKLKKIKDKMVVTLRTPWRPKGQQERVSSASTDTGVPIVLSADHPGFERPTSRTKGERPNHWAVLAYPF